MSIHKELSYDQKVEKIIGLQFSVMSAEDIINRSVCELTSTDTFANEKPIIDGLFDPRMGVVDANQICKTCENKPNFCTGHFGHIVLGKPVFYIQYFNTVFKLLKCICFRCSKVLIDSSNKDMARILSKKLSRQKKFEAIYNLCPIKRCGLENKDGCGAKQPDKYVKDTLNGTFILEWKELESTEETIRKQKYYAEDILKIFQRITDTDIEMLGFAKNLNRPENMICTVFPVPPPTVRPSVRNDTGQRCEDDLTHKLCDIVKVNNTLKSKLKSKTIDPAQIEQWTKLLQYHITTFVDNKQPSLPSANQRTGRPLRSLTERLKSKEGRIRGNLMGKRVDYSARSVITPDANISIDELGVPIKIAMNLTFPEIVTSFNKEKLTKMVLNGPTNYPGAKFLRKANENNRIILLKNIDITTLTVEIGDIVDRHLLNGDWVIFNRQPSLHRMSMQAHKVIVMPFDTFRLNAAVTPYM
jgi:DNA-directed RNA polymerase II subunit RPB1